MNATSSSIRRRTSSPVIVELEDGREALVTGRVEAAPGPLAALPEVVVVPSKEGEGGTGVSAKP